jgi:membrane protein YdbS with pleckstrin-like domain
MLCVYAAGWIFGMCVFAVSVLIAAPALIWLVIPVLIFACVKMLVVLAVHRIDYELRWYIITDTSITVREGAWTVQEITASYQNIQNVRVTQGPVERLFGFANVRIDTAGSGGKQAKGEGVTGHHAVLRGVTNAQQIRDTILDNLRAYRNAGLGDPDDVQSLQTTTQRTARVEILRDILQEASAIKATVSA